MTETDATESRPTGTGPGAAPGEARPGGWASLSADAVMGWLLDRADQPCDLRDLLAEFCVRLHGLGLPLWRVSLGIELLHPDESGALLNWRDGRIDRSSAARAGMMTNSSYLLSPMKIVDDTNRPFRCRTEEGTLGFPLMEELAADGCTDYWMVPLPFLDRDRSAAMSFATRRPGGFAEPDLILLEAAARRLAPWAERLALRTQALDLLGAYLGAGPGARVYAGQVERGEVRSLDAAIWVCDLRGFTSLSERLGPERTVALLNRWFDALGTPIEAAGGEILKFMGDGLLAVFPIEGEAAPICRAAYRAALGALARTADPPDDPEAGPFRFGIALHRGSVAFGNVGTRTRLDFTVIGPAVNLASRLQDLTKELGRPLLLSEALAAELDVPLERLGTYAVRGVEQPVRVFAPA